MNGRRASRPRTERTGDPAPVTIDLLVLFTRAAVRHGDGPAALRSQVEKELHGFQAALDLSDCGIRLRAHGLREVAGVDDRSAVATLAGLTDMVDPRFPDAHQLRDELAADLVCLVTGNQLDARGKSYLMSVPSPQFAPWAFSLVRCDALWRPDMTLAHELAHVFGCDHDVGHIEGEEGVAHGHGLSLEVDGERYRTILAMGGGTLLPHFSDPLIRYGEVAAGVAGRADNARVLRENAAIVAAFR